MKKLALGLAAALLSTSVLAQTKDLQAAAASIRSGRVVAPIRAAKLAKSASGSPATGRDTGTDTGTDAGTDTG